jgi:hypothetical protein
MTEILSKEELFKAAPRASAEIKIGDGVIVTVLEMSVMTRLNFVDFCKANKNNNELCQAWLVQQCTPVLQHSTAREVLAGLKPEFVTGAFLAIQEISGVNIKDDDDEDDESAGKGEKPEKKG